MKKLIHLMMLITIGLQAYACSSPGDLPENEPGNDTTINAKTMKLKITVGDKTATGVLYDNPTGRDFAKRLPLTVKMDDYSNTEKIFYPEPKLSTQGAPAGFDPSVGDITVYTPWGNVALFYKDFGYSKGLISVGKITSGMEAFSVSGSVTVKFELENK